MPKILLVTDDPSPVKLNLPADFQIHQITPNQDIFEQIASLQPAFILLSSESLLHFISEQSASDKKNIIVTKTRNGFKRVNLTEIQYFVAEHKYVLAYYKDGELLLNESLNSLELKYHPNVLRIHRNTLINTRWIDELINEHNKYYVTIKGTQIRLNVSRRQLPVVRKYMKCGKLE